ncbi:DUF6708 domain-containing protein [Azonexus caeni]|jgi:hypothetical protein|uniref:DUF6708 domain-containing protein n=1 Tax=Azonexus caeni TaxID=266126 RepID=UPI003A85A782
MIKWLKLLYTFKLPANYFRIDGSVKAEPSSRGTQVLRLDENAALIDTRQQAHPMVAGMAPWIIAGIFFMCYFLVTGINDLLFPRPTNEPPASLVSHIVDWVMLAMFFYVLATACWLVHMLIIQPSPSPLLLDRKARKVYGSYRGKLVEMDWNRVKPAITRGAMANRGGVMTLYNFSLAQFAAGQEPSNKTVECGILLSSANIGMEPCVALWEFIRIYMDEAPEKLPATEVSPETSDWTQKWLERGPYGSIYLGQPIITLLRENNGVPRFDFWISVAVWFMAPGMFFSLYDTWLRPQIRLKPEWIPALPTDSNPYAITLADDSDRPLREKGARLVILWTVALMVSGCASWWWVISALVSA